MYDFMYQEVTDEVSPWLIYLIQVKIIGEILAICIVMGVLFLIAMWLWRA